MSFGSNTEAILQSHRFLRFLRSLFVVPSKRVATRSDMRLCTGLRKNFKIKIETMKR